MKRALPIAAIIIVLTVVLMLLGLTSVNHSAGTVGIAAGSAVPGFTPNASTPQQAVDNFLLDVQRRNWDRAYAAIQRTSDTLNEQSFIQAWTGSDGGLRSFSSLEDSKRGLCMPQIPTRRCACACTGLLRSDLFRTFETSISCIPATIGRWFGTRILRPTFPLRSYR